MYKFKTKKIIKLIDVDKIFKKIKKTKKIVHCHGVFDLVHPGHLRHFSFCKSKADILVVSLTADKFIRKGLYRPFVPEQLRATNLAALEIVDYVIIDNFKHPYNLIKKLKPDFFAKGLEYVKNKNPLTADEKLTVEKSGGKMLFSPGDIIYSSSKIIDKTPPSITLEKLKLYLNYTKQSLSNLKDILPSMKNIKVHIVGDLIVDTVTSCNVIGGFHKTPTISAKINTNSNYVGGAGIVAKHFSSFLKDITLTTLISNDTLGKYSLRELKKSNIKVNALYEKNRPTTNKNSFWVDNYKLLKVDNVNNENIESSTVNKISEILKKDKSDIIIFSDFRHGVFNQNSIPVFIKSISKSKFKVADSQVASRWGNIVDFKNFDLITPTEKEARLSLHEQDLPVRTLCDLLLKKTKAKNVILKLGEKGLISLDLNRKDYISLDPMVNNILDTSGAGDALLAYSAATLFHTKSLILSSIMGILAASCKCESEGNVPVSVKQINEKIESIMKEIDNS